MNKIIVDAPLPNLNGINNYEVSLKIQAMLKSGRRYFGSAGASLSHHVNNPDYTSEFKHRLVNNGLEGERSTSLILQKWAKKIPNAVVFDSVHIRGMGKEEIDEESGMIEGGDTDHIIVIGNHVILIDTKRWRSGWFYSVNEKGQVIRGKRNFGGGRVHASQAKRLWKQYLDTSAKVSSIVCINAKDVKVRKDKNWKKQSWKLHSIEEIESTLDYRYEKMDDYDKTHINTSLIAQIVVCCIKPFDPYKRVFDQDSEAFKNFK